MPFTRIEIVLLAVGESGLEVLLARREAAPYKGRWALPGGVLRIDLDRSLEGAAARVATERVGRELPWLRQLCTVGGPTRDPRAPWGLSIVYRGIAPNALVLEPGKRIEQLTWRSADDAMNETTLAFDHAALIRQAVEQTRAQVEDLALPVAALPDAFTLGELQAWCERILGRPLDKSSFRRRLNERGLVEAIEGRMKGGAFRPAQLYRVGR